MDMNTTFFLKKEDRNPRWHQIDATGMVLGRLCTKIADVLRGKDRAGYTPNADGGDYVVVVNAEKIKLTGNKLRDKIYSHYTGWRGGLKEIPAKNILEKHPERLIEHAVKGMLPKNKLNRQILKKLRVYAGDQHPHAAQIKGHGA